MKFTKKEKTSEHGDQTKSDVQKKNIQAFNFA